MSTDKIVTHEDLGPLQHLRELAAAGSWSKSCEVLDRLIAAAEADAPPLPEGWVVCTTSSRMSAPQPVVRTLATVTHIYTFEPSDERTTLNFRGEAAAVTWLSIARDQNGQVRAEWDGVARKADGSWGRAQRTGRLLSRRDAPDWLRSLIDAVPTPKVTTETGELT